MELWFVEEGHECGNGVHYEIDRHEERTPKKLQIMKKLKNVMEKL